MPQSQVLTLLSKTELEMSSTCLDKISEAVRRTFQIEDVPRIPRSECAHSSTRIPG